jgi:hypothetical protein
MTDDDALGPGTSTVLFYSDPSDISEANVFDEPDDPVLLIVRVDGEIFEEGQYTTLEDFMSEGVEVPNAEPYTAGSYPALRGTITEDEDFNVIAYAIELGERDWILAALIISDGPLAQLDEVVLQPLVRSLAVIATPRP